MTLSLTLHQRVRGAIGFALLFNLVQASERFEAAIFEIFNFSVTSGGCAYLEFAGLQNAAHNLGYGMDLTPKQNVTPLRFCSKNCSA